jgi:hypothetical protein
MTDQKPTPAPWGIQQSSGKRSGDKLSYSYSITAFNQDLPNIASIPAREGESLANAQLIVSAPDLLQACLDAKAVIGETIYLLRQSGEAFTPAIPALAAAYAVIITAISNATGETNG